jgi:Glycine zipper/WXXGXW repeat (2 copies)
MKTIVVQTVTGIGLVSLLAGCTTPYGRPDYTANGALIGGASGAVLGSLADRRAPGAGALIGGAAGLIAGGLIGHSMDQDAEARERAAATYAPPPPSTPPPSINDIKAMARAGVSDDVIIAQIVNSRAVYNLDADALIDLHNAGVSEKVITCMENTVNVVVGQAPPPPPAETVVAAPSPDYVWVDGAWAWNGVTYVWIGGHWVLPPYRHAVWVRVHWERGPRGWYRVGGRWR